MKESSPASSARWPLVRWRFSVILPVALVLVLLTAIFAEPRKDLSVIRVVSAVSGDAMPGALITVGDQHYLTDEHGEVRVELPERGTDIDAHVNGFAKVDMPSRQSGGMQVIQMQPALVNGVVKDAITGAPIAGAVVTLLDEGRQQVASLRTDSHGAYIFKVVPGGAALRIHAAGYIDKETSVGAGHQLDVMMIAVGPLEEVGVSVSSRLHATVDALSAAVEGGE